MELLSAGTVITGEGSTFYRDGGVLVDGGQVVAVGPRRELRAQAEFCGAEETAFPESYTILPGLVDCHVHLAFDGSDRPVQRLMSSSDAMTLAVMLRHADALLSAGVTTARDLGAPALLDLAVKEAVETGVAPGPRLVVANQPITITGGHCWFMGCERDDVIGLRRAVREHHKAGADLIKLMVTGGFMTRGSDPLHAQFSRDEVCAVVEEAHALGMRVSAHAHGTEGIRRAVAASVDTIEHCSWSGERGVDFDIALAEEIAAREIVVCPTVNARSNIGGEIHDFEGSAGLPVVTWDERAAVLRQMRDVGVRFVAGSDAGMNQVLHSEYANGLEVMTDCGFSALEVIECATSRAAEALGLGNSVGSLAAGKFADIIVVAGDATVDLRALQEPRAVIKGGVKWGRGACRA